MVHGRTTKVLLVAAVATTAFVGWQAIEVSAEVNDLRSIERRLRADLRSAYRSMSEAEIERNDYRSLARDLETQLEGACGRAGQTRPQVELHPNRGPIGTRVRVTGRCFIRDFNDYDEGPSYIGLVGTPDGTFCELMAPIRGSVDIGSSGRMMGRFTVIRKKGACFEKTRRMRIRPGLYSFTLGCHGCGWATFEVTRRPYWWIDSVGEAIEWVAGKVDVPVALPPIPDGVHLYWENPIDIDKVGDATVVTINLKLGSKRWLHLIYGVASIWRDGCEPPARRAVDVNGERALLTKPDGYYKWSTIVWPVEPGSLEGHYGIDGSIRPKKALELAREMQLNTSTAPVGVDKSC